MRTNAELHIEVGETSIITVEVAEPDEYQPGFLNHELEPTIFAALEGLAFYDFYTPYSALMDIAMQDWEGQTDEAEIYKTLREQAILDLDLDSGNLSEEDENAINESMNNYRQPHDINDHIEKVYWGDYNPREALETLKNTEFAYLADCIERLHKLEIELNSTHDGPHFVMGYYIHNDVVNEMFSDRINDLYNSGWEPLITLIDLSPETFTNQLRTTVEYLLAIDDLLNELEASCQVQE